MIEKKVNENDEFYESGHFGGSRVLFTYGSLDTWMPLGHLKNSSNVTCLVIDGAYHCEDIVSRSSEAIARANDFATDILLAKWIKEN
jgi:hypothetical protein